jgi:hypothetical protein
MLPNAARVGFTIPRPGRACQYNPMPSSPLRRDVAGAPSGVPMPTRRLGREKKEGAVALFLIAL